MHCWDGVCRRGCAWLGCVCSREGHVCQGGMRGGGVCTAGEGMHGRGASVHGRDAWGCVWQGMHGGGHAWQGVCIPQQILRDTVKERAVRILLECILVRILFIAISDV